jgi:Domain of Unknown Function (DUF1080)
MRLMRLGAVGLLALCAGLVLAAKDGKEKDDGFVPMFNGKDLSGWVNANCAPGTFYVKDGEVITTGHPTGFLRTPKHYENFIADFEWMHVNTKEVGNSGFFVWADPLPAVGSPYTRGIEVQVLVNLTYRDKKGNITATSQGDLFSIWGATCKPDRPHPSGSQRCLPSENRCKGGGEWNHYRVTANDGRITLEVNGKEVSGVSECKPRKGYLALESEGAECHFRNLKIKELPSTNPKPDEVCGLDQGFKQLYTGLDFSGWKLDEAEKSHWKGKDWQILFDGKGPATKGLRTEKTFGDAEFVVDFKFPKKDGKGCRFLIAGEKPDEDAWVEFSPDGLYGVHTPTSGSKGRIEKPKPTGDWNRLVVSLKGSELNMTLNGAKLDPQKVPESKTRTWGLLPQGEMTFGNLFARELK